MVGDVKGSYVLKNVKYPRSNFKHNSYLFYLVKSLLMKDRMGLVQNSESQNPENLMPGSIKLNAGQFFGISYHSRSWHSGFIRIPVELGLVQNPESQNPENLMSGTLSLMQANFS